MPRYLANLVYKGLCIMTITPFVTAQADEPALHALRQAATFYASFDEAVRGDFGGGALNPGTRFNHETEPGQFVFEAGIDRERFTIAPGQGIHGGALRPTDVLPRNGRIYFPLRGNVAYRPGGWGGAVSLWCNGNPNELLKTTFCDPIQITERGANNGGIWFDFNNARPRDLRHGAFPAVPNGEKPIAEDDPQAPLVRVPAVDWQTGQWHHVVLSWNHFDSGEPNATSSLYIDGQLLGQIRDRAIAMRWNVDRAGIYIAVNYLGLLDELTIFGRPLTHEEVQTLRAVPGGMAPLKHAPPTTAKP